MEETALAAKDFSNSLHVQQQIPVFNYGAASSERKVLKNIRKKLGYFDVDLSLEHLHETNEMKNIRVIEKIRRGCEQNIPTTTIVNNFDSTTFIDKNQNPDHHHLEINNSESINCIRQIENCLPDFGSVIDLQESKGVTLVGAVPFVQNFNMRFRITDLRSQILQVTNCDDTLL